MIRSGLLMVFLVSTTTLHGQQRIPTPTARRAIDFAIGRHSERVLREKMEVVCAKSRPIPKEKAWCLIWHTGLRQQLSGVRSVEESLPYDTLAHLLKPFSATRLEAAALHLALSTPLGQSDSVEVDPVLTTLRAHFVGPDTVVFQTLVPFLQGTSPADSVRSTTANVPPEPEVIAQPDALVPVPDATPWKIGTALGGVLALLGWAYAALQRRQALAWRARNERLQREFKQAKASAWLTYLSPLRSRDEESPTR